MLRFCVFLYAHSTPFLNYSIVSAEAGSGAMKKQGLEM